MSRVGGVRGSPSIIGLAPKPAARSGFSIAPQAETLAGPVAAPATALAGMLALQEAETETAGNRKGRQHGMAMLQALREVQQSLLGTTGQAASLANLARLADQADFIPDTGLSELLHSIRLRAKIELLRHRG